MYWDMNYLRLARLPRQDMVDLLGCDGKVIGYIPMSSLGCVSGRLAANNVGAQNGMGPHARAFLVALQPRLGERPPDNSTAGDLIIHETDDAAVPKHLGAKHLKTCQATPEG